ncbi:MAG: helix-turn-helix domain-containing protein, partial [Paracoccaceae bacterium]
MGHAAAIRLGFLMFPGFPMACLTAAIEPLRAANEITGQRHFEWVLLAETATPVISSAEVRFQPDQLLGDCADIDQLYLLSPPTGQFSDARRGPARLRWLDRTGVILGAFSGGIFPLARAGLMEGHGCSVHWCYEAAFKAEFPKVIASAAVILRGRRTTVSGAGAVFDLMLRLIEERLGRETMIEVACWFQHPFVRDENARQTVPVAKGAVPGASGTEDALPKAIRGAIAMFDAHIEDTIRIPDVALAVDMSERHFERLFKRETGQSPLRYYRMMRLAKARQRVLYSTDSLTVIAAA